jgi:hypothetical protein
MLGQGASHIDLQENHDKNPAPLQVSVVNSFGSRFAPAFAGIL